MSPGRSRGPEPADVEIGAVARAKRIRFSRRPETRVDFYGEPEIESDSHSERESLSDEVEPGKVYRDVEVRWRAGARIADDGIRELEEEIAARKRAQGRDDEQSKES